MRGLKGDFCSAWRILWRFQNGKLWIIGAFKRVVCCKNILSRSCLLMGQMHSFDRASKLYKLIKIFSQLCYFSMQPESFSTDIQVPRARSVLAKGQSEEFISKRRLHATGSKKQQE